MRKYLLLLMPLFAALAMQAQSVATTVSYNKTDQPALVLELPYDQEVSEGFIVENLKKIGFTPESQGSLFWKKNKVNGYYQFKGVRLDENSAEAVDLYFKVEPKSRKEKDKSIIYFLVGRGTEPTFVSYEKDEKTFNASKKFLNAFVDQSAGYKLDLDIKNQEETVKSAEKKMSKLQDEEKSLNKKIENLQKDLKENREDQEKQKKAVEQEQARLLELRSKKG